MGGESIVSSVSGKTYRIIVVQTLGGDPPIEAAVLGDLVYVVDVGDTIANLRTAHRAIDHHDRDGYNKMNL